MGGAGWVAEKFDRRAPSYDQSVPHRWQARRAVEFLAPAWGQRLLDVATGTGLAAREAASLIGPDGLVVGADVSMGMLRAARQAAGGTGCRFAQADATALPFPAGVFDAAVCVAGVSYFPDPAAALAEWRRVCRPTAQAVVTTPTVDGITTARVLRQAAACEGIELEDPGGPLADPARRGQVLAAAGWDEEQVDEVVFEEALADPGAAFGFVDSGFAEPLRTASPQVRQRVWVCFEGLYRAEEVEAHRMLRLASRPLDASPTHSRFKIDNSAGGCGRRAELQ